MSTVCWFLHINILRMGEFMRKNFTLVFVLMLCVVMCAFFVACDKNGDETKENKGIVITSDMTADQIREALKDVKSFTMIITYGTDIQYVQKWFENGFSESETYSGVKHAIFEENNREYEFDWGNGELKATVIDLNGYDSYKANHSKTYIDIYLSLMDRGYTVENGQLILGGGAYVAKDFNCSTMDIPSEYKNYATLKTNASVLDFEDISETECKLSSINVTLNTLVVPEKYNGKTVVEISQVDRVWTKLSIPTTVTKLGSIWISSDTQPCTIEYAGTKEQWAKIQKTEHEWAPSNKLIIQCSDGIIENNNQAE